MRVSRRIFLGGVTAAPALARDYARPARCAVVDVGCVLPESLEGYSRQLRDLPHVVIPPDGKAIREFLRSGGTVLLECTGFEELGIEVGGRVRLEPYFPYVEYFWPIRVKIREFAPVWFQPAPQDVPIAIYGGKPVALRRSVGGGTLVALGSPLGPMFLTGDPDARSWLEAFLLPLI